jgi:cytochrome P450
VANRRPPARGPAVARSTDAAARTPSARGRCEHISRTGSRVRARSRDALRIVRSANVSPIAVRALCLTGRLGGRSTCDILLDVTAPLPPAVPGWPIVGNAVDYLRDPLAFLCKTPRLYGDVVRMRLGAIEATLLSHPAAIEEVLVTQNRSFKKDQYIERIRPVLGDGLLTSEGDFWRRQRRLAQPAFHRDRIAAYGATMVDYGERLAASFRAGEVRDIHKDMMRVTLEIVAKTLFGAEVEDHMATEVGEALEVVVTDLADPLPLFVPVLRKLPTPQVRRLRSAIQRLDAIILGIIRARRTRKDDVDGGDLLSMLLHAQDDDGTRMTDKQLRDEVMTLFLAGHETTAIALSWTWLLLSDHPHVDAALERELDTVLGGRPPTMADLPRLEVANAIVLESMRLYPPAWSLGREATVDCTIGGFHVPRGAQVWMCPWSVQRDPRWFDDPERFLPERWRGGELQKRLPKYAYFPFGGGPRLCIGQSFAMMEAVLLLAAIAQRVRLRLAPGQRIESLPAVTLRPKYGLRVEVERRAPPLAAIA